jgi:hypothetical protein
MTITKTMTPIPAAMANATGVRAETVVLSPFHPASHASHRSRGIGDPAPSGADNRVTLRV